MTGPPSVDAVSLRELFVLEETAGGYRAPPLITMPDPVYGGQIAAQALYAAGRTVPAGRVPHSLHGYFLRPGTTGTSTEYMVDRVRDGGSYSARQVVATQNGRPIFTLAASFAAIEAGVDRELTETTSMQPLDAFPTIDLPFLLSFEARVPVSSRGHEEWPATFWARCKESLGASALLHACVLTYLSDFSSGLIALDGPAGRAGPSLDHAVWFHRPVKVDDWVWVDLSAQSVAGGRGFYRGTVRRRDGVLAATITQESLFRPDRPRVRG